jgi:acyl-CoA thioesterase-1
MRIVVSLRSLFCAFLLAVAPFGSAQDKSPVLLVVGDSVSAAYGLTGGQGWVELLSKKLAAEGYRYRLVNASISGDTTAGGRARLPALLAQHKPAVVIVELGGNDALRGGKLATTRDNLDAMLVVGMEIPPNYGPAYAREFRDLYTSVSSTRKVPLVPSFFAGFGEDLSFFQPDRIHPTAQAQSRLLDNVWPQLVPLLKR